MNLEKAYKQLIKKDNNNKQPGNKQLIAESFYRITRNYTQTRTNYVPNKLKRFLKQKINYLT